jgi:hypothetical protein
MMRKIIVTTTINEPTEATRKYSQKEGWTLLVVGDLKTPHHNYNRLNCVYLHPEVQETKYPVLSRAIGWNSIQRRNIGFLAAYDMGADIVATVDDDNIPYENWGKNLLVGEYVHVDLYEPEKEVFDPLSVTLRNDIWHRGYPIEYLQEKNRVVYKGKTQRYVRVQADLWDGDPDIDAIARLSKKPIVKYSEITEPYCSNKIAPFNSQNTFLHRSVLPFYSVLPYIGRMDDIWGAYILQKFFPNSVIYNRASVYQDRNVQDLITNLEKEIIGYRNTLKLINDIDNFEKFLPEETLNFWNIYRKSFKGV